MVSQATEEKLSMKTILFAFLTQLLPTVGSVVVAGLFIHLCKRLFVRACGKHAAVIVNYSGIIGTPVHELSHAAMCFVFGHKIKKMKLFSIDKRNGTLGYVKHSFNPRNLRHRIGNFFIGIAPVVSGSFVVLLLMWLFMPTVCSQVSDLMQTTAQGSLSLDTVTRLGYAVVSIFRLIFARENLENWKLWVFVFLAATIAIHMELSTADIQGGQDGFLFLAGGFLIADVALYFLKPEWLSVLTNAMIQGGLHLTSLLLLSVVFAGCVGLLSLLILALKKIF